MTRTVAGKVEEGFRVSGEYWDSWDWRAVQKALVGDITTDGYTRVNEIRNGDPSSTLNLTSALSSLVLAFNSALLNVRAQKKALIDDGAWAGDAADSFETLMRRVDKTLEHSSEQLYGNQGVIMALLEVYVAHKNGVDRVIELNHKGATQTKERYDRLCDEWCEEAGRSEFPPPLPKQPWFTNSKGETIYTSSTYPDIDNKMSEEARGIMRDVVSVYRVKHALLRTVQPPSSLMTVSPVTPEFPTDGAPTNPNNPNNPNSPVKPVDPANAGKPVGPPVSPALPVTPSNPAGTPSPVKPPSPAGPPASPAFPVSPTSPNSPVAPPVSPAVAPPVLPTRNPALSPADSSHDQGTDTGTTKPGGGTGPGSFPVPSPAVPNRPSTPSTDHGGPAPSFPVPANPDSHRPGTGPNIPGISLPHLPQIPHGVPGGGLFDFPGSHSSQEHRGIPGAAVFPGGGGPSGSGGAGSGMPAGAGLPAGGVQRPDSSPPLSGAFPELGGAAADSAPSAAPGLPTGPGGSGQPSGSGQIVTSARSALAGGGMPNAMGPGSGMPYMPMSPMAGGNNQKEERERSTWLSEDEEVWSPQDDAVPAVVQGMDPTQVVQVVPVAAKTPRQPAPGPAHRPTREQSSPRYRTTGA